MDNFSFLLSISVQPWLENLTKEPEEPEEEPESRLKQEGALK